MSQIKIFSSLLEGHWLHITTNLEIEIAHANCTLSKHHINCLCDCTISLVFELGINGESDLSLSKLSLRDVM